MDIWYCRVNRIKHYETNYIVLWSYEIQKHYETHFLVLWSYEIQKHYEIDYIILWPPYVESGTLWPAVHHKLAAEIFLRLQWNLPHRCLITWLAKSRGRHIEVLISIFSGVMILIHTIKCMLYLLALLITSPLMMYCKNKIPNNMHIAQLLSVYIV